MTLPAGWAIRPLRELALGDGEYGSGASAKPYDPALPRYVRVTDMTQGGKLDPTSPASISWDDAAGHELAENDVLLARSGSVGKSYLFDPADAPAAHAGYVIRFRLDPQQCVPRYVSQYLRSRQYRRWVNRTLRQGAQPNINAQEYARLPIPCPPAEVQESIADALDAVDRLVAWSESEVAKLIAIETGLVADLYSAISERGALESLADVNPESLGSQTAPNYRFRYIDIGSVYVGDVSWDEVRTLEFGTAPTRARRVVRQGDVLFSTVRPLLRSHAIMSDVVHSPLVCSTGFAVLRPRPGVDPRFVYQSLFTVDFERQVGQRQVGSGYPAVNESDVRSIEVPLARPEDQTRIADMVESVQRLRHALERESAKARMLRLGLSDDLFTGRGIPARQAA